MLLTVYGLRVSLYVRTNFMNIYELSSVNVNFLRFGVDEFTSHELVFEWFPIISRSHSDCTLSDRLVFCIVHFLVARFIWKFMIVNLTEELKKSAFPL